MMDADDLDALAKRSAAGDHDAFRELVEATITELRCFVAVKAASTDMIEEAVQAAYVACYENIGEYRPTRTFLPWLKGIARNRLARLLRERTRWLRVHPDQLETLVADADEVDTDDRAALVQALRNCMEQLSPDARQLVSSYYGDGVPLTELAERLQRRRGTLAVTLLRIRALLRDCLTSKGALHE